MSSNIRSSCFLNKNDGGANLLCCYCYDLFNSPVCVDITLLSPAGYQDSSAYVPLVSIHCSFSACWSRGSTSCYSHETHLKLVLGRQQLNLGQTKYTLMFTNSSRPKPGRQDYSACVKGAVEFRLTLFAVLWYHNLCI